MPFLSLATEKDNSRMPELHIGRGLLLSYRPWLTPAPGLLTATSDALLAIPATLDAIPVLPALLNAIGRPKLVA